MLKPIDIHTHTASGKTSVYNMELGDILNMNIPDSPFSVGLHPWEINNSSHKHFENIEQIIKSPNCVAIGECGMDKLRNVPEELQYDVFIYQAKLAELTSTPLIIHCVKYFNEILNLREENKFSVPWIFHGFNSSFDLALSITRSNCYISFGHSILNPSKKLKNCVEKLSVEHLFFETDDSGLMIEDIYNGYSAITGINQDELIGKIHDNLKKCFPGKYAKLLA